MIRSILYLVFLFLIYSCAPINKQHGYMIDDILFAIDDLDGFVVNKSHKNDILNTLGSPSIKISDVDDVWIYLISIKQENVFEKDEISFQHILRFQFDDRNFLLKFDSFDKTSFTEIAFSDEKTTITRDAYGISDQIYDAFTRGAN